MPHEQSPYGGGAPRLLAQHARLMARQIYRNPRVSCRELSKKGAFVVSRTGFGETMLIDAHVLDRQERRALRMHAPRYDATATVDTKSGRVIAFRSPHASVRLGSVRSRHAATRCFTIPVLELNIHKRNPRSSLRGLRL